MNMNHFASESDPFAVFNAILLIIILLLPDFQRYAILTDTCIFVNGAAVCWLAVSRMLPNRYSTRKFLTNLNSNCCPKIGINSVSEFLHAIYSELKN